MKKPLIESLIFHVVIAILLIISTWSFFSRKVEPLNEIPIVVQLAPMGEKTNLKPAPKQAVKPPAPKKVAPKPPEPKKPEPKKPEPKPEPKKPDVKKPEPKKPDTKPEPKKPDTKKPEKKPEKPKVDELDALLKNLDEKPTPEKSTDAKVTKEDSKSDQQFDPNSPEALAETDYIAKLINDQVRACWSPPMGGHGAKNIIVRINVDIAQNGVMKFVSFEGTDYAGDPVGQAAADAAKRAVLDPDCNPLKTLPPADKYSIWKEITLIFDPKDLGN